MGPIRRLLSAKIRMGPSKYSEQMAALITSRVEPTHRQGRQKLVFKQDQRLK